VFLNQSTAQYENSQRDGAIFDVSTNCEAQQCKNCIAGMISTQRCRTLKTRKVRSDPVLGAAYYWIFSDVKAAKDCDIPSL